MNDSKYTIEKIDQTIVLTSPTGEKMYPDCGEDLMALYAYEVGSFHFSEEENERRAQELLASAMRGEKPITNMLQRAHSTF